MLDCCCLETSLSTKKSLIVENILFFIMGPTFTVHNRVLFKIIGNVLWYILYSRNKKNAHTHTFID